MALSNKDHDIINMFAAHALSGYIRDGLSLMNAEAEAKDVATGCFQLAEAMFVESKTIRELAEN